MIKLYAILALLFNILFVAPHPIENKSWFQLLMTLYTEVTQIAGVNPYANWPEGPRLNWDEIPEDLRPGREPMQRPQALGIEERKQQMMLEERKKSMF